MPVRSFIRAVFPRRLLLVFTILSAVVNGTVTAVIGAWLAQTYSTHQTRRQSIQSLSTLMYERRVRAELTVSALRRNADIDEVRHRKRTCDEAYVDWNRSIQVHLFAMRDVIGAVELSALEQDLEAFVVKAFAEIDTCLTKGYDLKAAGQDPLPAFEACNMRKLHQYIIDCGSTFTDELYKMSRLTFNSFLPFSRSDKARFEEARAEIARICTQPA